MTGKIVFSLNFLYYRKKNYDNCVACFIRSKHPGLTFNICRSLVSIISQHFAELIPTSNQLSVLNRLSFDY